MELTERVTRETRDAAGVLVLRPRSAFGSDPTCRRLLAGDSRPISLFGVSFSRSPARWYDDWVTALGGPPANAAVVTTPDRVGDGTPDAVDVETVPTPADLTGIGLRATQYTSSWTGRDGLGNGSGDALDASRGDDVSDGSDAGADVVVSVDSLDLLLQYTSLESLYRFLHVLVGRLDTLGFDGRGDSGPDGPHLGARGLFFLDPTTQDEATVTTLESLFHAVLSYEGDDEWRLRTQ